MAIKVGINGFGRIGRIIARACVQNSDLQLAAINDPAISTEYMCYLLKFDSTHGKLKSDITHCDDIITIDDVRIKVFHGTMPSSIPWQTAGVQYVVESSGMFVTLDKASGHLENSGVKRVIVTAPSADVPMVILGVNDQMLCPRQKVISCASSTLYCLAPIIKILEDNFGVSEGLVTSIHSMTPSLKPLDGLCTRGKHWRDHRSIHQNIIPAATGACKALGKIIPQVKDKLSGLAFRVPIVDVSVLDLSIRLKTYTNLQDIVKAVEKASQTHMVNIIEHTNEDTVSSDFMGTRYSCILDINCSIQLKPNFYKIVCWYENEYSYACRVIDSIFFSEKQQCFTEFPPTRHIAPATVMKSDEMLQTESISVHVASIACACDTGVAQSVGSSDIFFQANSVSADTSSSQLILKKALQGGPCCYINKDTNNAMFSLSHGSNKTSTPIVKRNVGSSSFQSCIAFTQPDSPENKFLNAKEQLEKLRREYSEMINITEDYVQKSSSNQVNKKFATKYNAIKKMLAISNLDTMKMSLEIKPMGDPSTHYKNLKESKDSDVKSDSSNFFALSTTDVKESDAIQHIESELQVDHKSHKDIKVIATTEVKDKITNIVGINKFKRKEDKFELSISDVDSSQAKRMLKSAHDPDVSRQCKSHTTKNVHIFDQELKKRNIVLVDNPFTLKPIVEINDNKDISESQGKTEVSSEKIFNGFNQLSSDTAVIFSEGTLGRVSPVRRERHDVYDKLDSESETDSNNSFDIHGKKSQIINITDLTNSLEELTRLDKICRIIEISDELSDKLFLNLDDNVTIDKNKEWSFKELCEKIKLDEFCNKVFGPC